MTHLRWLFLPLVSVLLVFLVACGGDSDDDGDNGGSTGAGSTSTGAATGASTGASASATATIEPSASGATGSIDVESVAASLENVDSFRFNMRLAMDFGESPDQSSEDAAAAAMLLALLGNFEVEGEYVAQDRFRTSASIFGMDVENIQIGNESWTNDGSGWVQDDSAGSGAMSFDVSSPGDLFEFIPAEELEGAETSSETVNGFETTRFHFDKDSLEELASETGEYAGLGDLSEVDTLDLDIWLTSERLPVRMLMDVKGVSEGSEVGIQVEYNITDLNDPGITIERPE